MALPPPSTPASAREALLARLASYRVTDIELLDPATGASTTYDPRTDTGGQATPSTVWSGKARCVSQKTSNFVNGEWVTRTVYHFDIALDAPVRLRKGLLARITTAPNQEHLIGASFVLEAIGGGSQAVQKSFTAVTENGRAAS